MHQNQEIKYQTSFSFQVSVYFWTLNEFNIYMKNHWVNLKQKIHHPVTFMFTFKIEFIFQHTQLWLILAIQLITSCTTINTY